MKVRKEVEKKTTIYMAPKYSNESGCITAPRPVRDALSTECRLVVVCDNYHILRNAIRKLP